MHMPDFLILAGNWLLDNGMSLVAAIAVLVAGWHVARIAARAIKRFLPRAYGVDQNFAPLLSQAARYAIIIFAVVTALNLLGVANNSILTVLGAAGGAYAGNVVEKNMKKYTAYQMRVRMNDGSYRSFEQRSAIAAGTRVVVDNGNWRVAS